MMRDSGMFAILGITVAMSACGGGTQTGIPGTGSSPTASTSLSKDDSVLEAVLLHQLGSDDGIGCNSHALRTLADVSIRSTRETFSAASRDRKFC